MSTTIFTPLQPSARVVLSGSNAIAQTADGRILSNTTTHATAIQAALDGLTAGRTKQETVSIVGQFTCDAPIYIPSYTILDLSAAKLTKAASAANAHLLAVLPLAGNAFTEYVTIKGGILDGNRTNQTGLGDGIITKGRYCLFEDTEIMNMSLQGIDMHPDEADITTEAHSNIIRGIRSHNNNGIGIYCGMGASRNLIENCYCYDSNGTFVDLWGIFFDGPGIANKVRNCYCYNNADGALFATGQSNLEIDGLAAWANGTGLYFQGRPVAWGGETRYSPIINLLAHNVHSYDNTLNGISAWGIVNSTIDGCVTHGNDDIGILVGNHDTSTNEPKSTGISVTNCKSYSNTLDGIRILGHTANRTANVILTSNQTYNAPSGRDGIDIQFVDRFIIANNLCYDNQGSPTQRYGIRIGSVGANTEGLITNNMLYGNVTAQYLNHSANTRVKVTSNTETTDLFQYSSELWPTYLLNASGNANQFMPIGGTTRFTTEADTQLTVPHEITVKRFTATIQTNAKNAATTISLRSGTPADIAGTVLSIPAGSLVAVDSGDLNVVMAANSKFTIRVDTSASASGSLSMGVYVTVIRKIGV